MLEMKQNRKTYNQSQFRRVLQSKVSKPSSDSDKKIKKNRFKNDDCDLLIYLIQVKYLSELMKEGSRENGEDGELTASGIELAHTMLMKKYKG